MALHLPKRRFTVTDYHRMAEAGILGEDDRVELIEGEVTQMTPIGRRRASCVAHLSKLLERTFGDDAVVWGQNPVEISEYTEPQPDLSLLRPRPDFYRSALPTPADVLLLVEVADATAGPDRRVKVPLYAKSGIKEIWLIDLEQENVTVYRDPTSRGYRTARVLRRGEQIAPLGFPDRFVAVTDILG